MRHMRRSSGDIWPSWVVFQVLQARLDLIKLKNNPISVPTMTSFFVWSYSCTTTTEFDFWDLLGYDCHWMLFLGSNAGMTGAEFEYWDKMRVWLGLNSISDTISIDMTKNESDFVGSYSVMTRIECDCDFCNRMQVWLEPNSISRTECRYDSEWIRFLRSYLYGYMTKIKFDFLESYSGMSRTMVGELILVKIIFWK